MPRHPNTKNEKTNAPDDGASNVGDAPPDQETIQSSPGIDGAPLTETAEIPQDAAAQRGKRYSVLNTEPVNILYGGCHSTIRPNKIIHDTAYDISVLRRQGVKLKEITEETLEA